MTYARHPLPDPFGYDAPAHEEPWGGDGRLPFSQPFQKAALLVETDSFVISHFQPLVGMLRGLAREVVVFTRNTGRLGNIEGLGVRVVEFDVASVPRSPTRQATTAWALARQLDAEKPDVIHAIGLRSAFLTALASRITAVPQAVVHMTGMGPLRISPDRRSRILRSAALKMLGHLIRQPTTYLLVENKDDLNLLRSYGGDPGPRFSILGGAGVDPNLFAALPPPRNPLPVAAFVARMTYAKGADVLMEAFDILAQHNVRVQPLLCGRCEPDHPDSILQEHLTGWCQTHGGVWRDHIADIGEVWQNADMFILPSRGGEGMPKAMLEAAASQRPLIVSNVPGCRDFVRHGVEGLLVPPDDPEALAQAIARLASDSGLRQRLGEAARLRLLHGYTEAHVTQTLRESYATFFVNRR